MCRAHLHDACCVVWCGAGVHTVWRGVVWGRIPAYLVCCGAVWVCVFC